MGSLKKTINTYLNEITNILDSLNYSNDKWVGVQPVVYQSTGWEIASNEYRKLRAAKPLAKMVCQKVVES